MADRLTLDAAAAIRAGMSYGQWKALHPYTEGTMPNFRKIEDQIPCEYCGTLFVKKKSNNRFCCIACSQRASYFRHIEKRRQGDKERRERRKAQAQQEGK